MGIIVVLSPTLTVSYLLVPLQTPCQCYNQTKLIPAFGSTEDRLLKCSDVTYRDSLYKRSGGKETGCPHSNRGVCLCPTQLESFALVTVKGDTCLLWYGYGQLTTQTKSPMPSLGHVIGCRLQSGMKWWIADSFTTEIGISYYHVFLVGWCILSEYLYSHCVHWSLVATSFLPTASVACTELSKL